MYQALYRQFRPMTFDNLLGQDHIIDTLKNQIKNENVGHAYLFSGTRGTGKTSTAKIFSRAVNCLQPVDSSPCNECEICKGILDGSIMDVIEMDAASNRGVDDIKNLRDKVTYPPSYAKYKVYIIDEVHMLTKEAFNSLLKTLEEPPKHIIFILATTEPERIPETILSRCQRFDFKRIDNSTIIENMRMIVQEYNLEIEDEALSLIARNADGGMRDALSLLDQCISFGEDKISYEDVVSILGITNHDLIFKIVDDILEKDIESILLSIDKLMADGRDVGQFIKDIIKHFRDLMIVKSFNDPRQLVEVSQDLLDRYQLQAKDIRMSYIINILDILTKVEERSKYVTEARVVLEMSMIKMVHADNLSLEERIERLEEKLEKGHIKPSINMEREASSSGPTRANSPSNLARNITSPTSKASKEPASREKLVLDKDTNKTKSNSKDSLNQEIDPSKKIDLDLEKLQRDWDSIINAIRREKPNIAALLMEGRLKAFENDMIIVEYEEIFEFHRNAISNERNMSYILEILQEIYGQKLNIRFDRASDSSIELEESKKKDSKEKIKELEKIFGEKLKIKD